MPDVYKGEKMSELQDISNRVSTFKRDGWKALYPFLELYQMVLENENLHEELCSQFYAGANPNPAKALEKFKKDLIAAEEFLKVNFS